MNEFKKEANRTKCQTVMKALEKNNMKPYFCETKAEAADLVMSLIDDDAVVSWGGSYTIDELGVKDRIKAKGNKVIDRDEAPTFEENFQKRRESLLSDIFLTSANAITFDGTLVNIDNLGNRVAAMAFGPKKVVFVISANKICRDIDTAFKRVRTVTCPENAIRTDRETPCRITGKCAECRSKSTMCSVMQIIRQNPNDDRIHVILVSEDLGF